MLNACFSCSDSKIKKDLKSQHYNWNPNKLCRWHLHLVNGNLSWRWFFSLLCLWKLEITGGNPGLQDCQIYEEPITYNCHKSGGPHIVGHFLHTGKSSLKVDIMLMTWTWKQLLKSCKLFLNMEQTLIY